MKDKTWQVAFYIISGVISILLIINGFFIRSFFTEVKEFKNEVVELRVSREGEKKSFENLKEDCKENKDDIADNVKKLNEHETRITVLERDK